MKSFFVIIICLISAANAFGQQPYKYISADSYLLRPYVKELVGADYVPIRWVGTRSFMVPMLGNKLISIDEKYMDFFKKDFYITMPETSRVQEQKTEAGIGVAEKYAAMDASRVFDAEVSPAYYDVRDILNDYDQEYIPGQSIPFAVYAYTSGKYYGYLLGHDVTLSENMVSAIDPSDKSYLLSRGFTGQNERKFSAQKFDAAIAASYKTRLKHYQDSLRRVEEEAERERLRIQAQKKKDAKAYLQYLQRNKIILQDYDWKRDYGDYTLTIEVFNCFSKAIKRLDFTVIALDSNGYPRWYDKGRSVKKIWFNVHAIDPYEKTNIYWNDLYYDGDYDIEDFMITSAVITFVDNTTMTFSSQSAVDKICLWNHSIDAPEDWMDYIK